MMKIVLIHYHLKTGGVTTVLRQQLEAIHKNFEALVITGTPPKTPFPVDIIHIPQLAYSTTYPDPINPEAVADAIVAAIHSRFDGPCDVLHVHNPTLAKNRSFLKVLTALQRKGLNLLLQIHDFAEDGRPSAYFAEEYPADCHYCVINDRDYDVLLRAGLKKEGLHRLPNTVNPYSEPRQPVPMKPMVLYPIRAIRRKNIGEAILLSLFFKNQEFLAVTLPPNSPTDIKSYSAWKSFVKDYHFNVEFDKGLKDDFTSLMQSARWLITTSITEGFGFSFLEPWLFEKVLWGRELADICQDFESNGIRLDHLYPRLNVSLDWINYHQFFQTWKNCIITVCSLFQVTIDNTRIKDAFDTITENGSIDFGLLNEVHQKKIITGLIFNRGRFDQMCRLNPFLSDPGNVSNADKLVKNNKRAIIETYNKDTYRRKLIDMYQKVAQSEVKQRINKAVLISTFLNPEQFSLLKWSDYFD